MKTIRTFDETAVKVIQARAFELLAPLQAEFGVAFGDAAKGLGGDYCTLLFTLNFPPEEGGFELGTPDARAFKKYAPQHGIPAELLGKEFTAAGKSYRLLGYKKAATKNHFLLQSRSRAIRVSDSFVKQLLVDARLVEDVGERPLIEDRHRLQ